MNSSEDSSPTENPKYCHFCMDIDLTLCTNINYASYTSEDILEHYMVKCAISNQQERDRDFHEIQFVFLSHKLWNKWGEIHVVHMACCMSVVYE